MMGHIEWQCDDVTVDDGDVMGHIEWQCDDVTVDDGDVVVDSVDIYKAKKSRT